METNYTLRQASIAATAIGTPLSPEMFRYHVKVGQRIKGTMKTSPGGDRMWLIEAKELAKFLDVPISKLPAPQKIERKERTRAKSRA